MCIGFNFRVSMLLILTTLLSSRCGKNCSKIIQFQLPLTIYPQKERYQVNDTIWVEISISEFLEDKKSGDLINVGYHDFQVDMNTLELLDSNWIDGTQNVKIIPFIGIVEILGITFPEVVPHLVKFENEHLQKWKFGIIPTKPNKKLVVIFGKRDPSNWRGEFKFPESECIYGISSSTFLTNDGNIDYESYVLEFPFFRESGNGPNIAENHKNVGAFFIKVE